MDAIARRSRETTPDRAKPYAQQSSRRLVKASRKVQVVYYLSRNGHLEHPHFMEVTHLANQQLRLRDVIDRLTSLRGKGMPSLFSWSCKRSYKNGYVWNDLSENDVIYPSEGAEYVLKGSELIDNTAESIQQLQLSNRQQIPEPNFHPKRKQLNATPQREMRHHEEEDEEEQEHGEEFELDEEKTTLIRCSRGVSTEELEEHHRKNSNRTELTLDQDGTSPPSTSSTVSDKQTDSYVSSKRFEDGDSVVGLSRNSVLLQLIACGGKNPIGIGRKSSSSMHRGVLRKSAIKVVVSQEDDEINCMSGNPRFGNLQSEEKEYFSGSIVESMTTEERVASEPRLKRSSSYNEERSSKVGLGEAVEEEKREKAIKGKCMPRMKSSTTAETKTPPKQQRK